MDVDILIHEFGSLDASLVSAIAGEHDDLQEARTVLKALAASDSIDDAADNSDNESVLSSTLSTGTHETSSDVERTLAEWASLADEGQRESSPDSSQVDSTDVDYDANVTFLESMYPSRSRSSLKALLSEHGDDVEMVLDQLLNMSFLEDETTSAQLQQSNNVNFIPPSPRKRSRRRPPKSTTTFSLTDQGRLPASPAGSTDSLPLQSDNSWVTADSMSSHIADLLDISPGIVASLYHKKSSSFALTLDSLLDTMELKYPFDTLTVEPDILDNLSAMFAPADPSSETHTPITKRQWQKYLCATKGNVEHAIDLMSLQQEIHAREGSAVQVGLLKGFGSAAERASREQLLAKKDLDAVSKGVLRPDLSGWSVASSTASGNRPILYTPTLRNKSGAGIPNKLAKGRIMESALPDNPSASDCRAMAEEYRDNRNEAFKAAARHFQSGKSGGERGAGDRGAAAYWSEKGRDLDARARTWDLRAARAQVAERRVVSDNSIDLHNLTVNEALTVVKENVNTWWSASSNPRPLRIVTGAGRHSANRMPVLLPSVMKMLDREGWRVRRDPDGGSLIVNGVKDSSRTMA